MNIENKNSKPTRRPIFPNTNWGFFAISEGIFKTIQMSVFKIIGGTFSSFPFLFIITFIVGCIQTIGGLIINLRSRYEIFPKLKYVIGAVILGFISVYTSIVPMYIFSVSKVSVALIAFIISIVFIPKALIDKFLFKDPINSKQLLSIPLFLFGLYAFVGFPNISQIKGMPLWAILALTLPVAIFIEEFIARVFKVGVISPWVKNFWIGLSTVILSLIALVIINPVSLFLGMISNITFRFWILIIVLSFSILAQIFFKQRTYMHGGLIASKKIAMISSYLITSLIAGVIFFGGYINFWEVIGIISLIAGYFFVEQGAFNQLLSRLK